MGDGILIIISVNVSSIMTVQNSTVNCFAQLTDDIADDVIDLGLGGILSE